ncbi:sensor histidine kinase [Streptococcus sciuri]|uniref:histidine kinase n=1 Tax=Streptococcus sciuri TaxID=2973939 RepID=A0ABT2F6S0_9STRE|nr:sensor histidine kinase [Streptococcus sciuri]MCS4487888.1 sensor histidine kinase [Streptococcus sciuri]
MTYAKSRLFLWRSFIVVTLFAVIYHASLYLLCSTYITQTGASQDFLDKIGIIPMAPHLIFLGSIFSFVLLLSLIYLRHFLFEKSFYEEWFLLLEICLLLITFSFLQGSYNGVILLVLLDIFQTYTDFYTARQKRYWAIFLILSFAMLLLSNSQILAMVVKLPTLEVYLSFLPTHYHILTLFIKSFLSSFSVMIFIINLILAIIYSVAETHKIEEELRMAEQANRELHSYLAISEKNAKDKERKRIAREIHDTLGHALTGISAGIDAVLVLIDFDSDRAKKQLKDISKVVREGIKDVRRSIEKLRPGALEEQSLQVALEKIIRDYEVLSDLAITLDYQWGAVDLEVTKEDIIFRVVQESLTNSLRHGGAHHVDISMTRDDSYHLIIQDDGIGFETLHFGYGLTQMRERLAIIGATVVFRSEDGFKTIVDIPRQKGE